MTRYMLLLVVVTSSLLLSCTKGEKGTAPSRQEKKISPKPTDNVVGKALKTFLGGSKQVEVLKTAGGIKKLGSISSPEAVKALLQALNLDQKLTGGQRRCPDTFRLRFKNQAGQELGTVGFCGGDDLERNPPRGFQFTAQGAKGPATMNVSDGKAFVREVLRKLKADKSE